MKLNLVSYASVSILPGKYFVEAKDLFLKSKGITGCNHGILAQAIPHSGDMSCCPWLESRMHVNSMTCSEDVLVEEARNLLFFSGIAVDRLIYAEDLPCSLIPAESSGILNSGRDLVTT